jgi:DMSO/TMAO reductase YedYZ molybdopterin-dependent catalytic subunit
MNRRQFLSALSAAPLRPGTRQSVFGQSSPHDAEIRGFDFSSLAGPLTPNDQFYVRDHFAAPHLTQQGWKVEILGHVRTTFTVTHAEVLRLPARDLTVTVECAGNGVGEGGVSTATWTGIALKQLLERAGLLPDVKYVRLRGADHGNVGSFSAATPYARSIPLEKALHPDTLLAYRMNGSPLPQEHGYPVRAIIPGWYGMDSVKWLVQIEALTRSDASYFMTEAYLATRLRTIGSEQEPITRMRVKSQIARPRDGEVIPRGTYQIRGAAWAGENKVAKVEVSTDGGGTWAAASLQAEARPCAWTLWEYRWDAETPGAYTIVVRASDDRGVTQPSSRDSLRLDSYEQNSYHSVRCRVVSPESTMHGETRRVLDPRAVCSSSSDLAAG